MCVGAIKNVVCGDPDFMSISTSHVERANLTIGMAMRRFTRLTNAFSKKVEMHMHTVSLHFMHCNFARIHKTLKVTPAMRAGIAAHVWTIEEIVRLVPELESKKRGPYKARARLHATTARMRGLGVGALLFLSRLCDTSPIWPSTSSHRWLITSTPWARRSTHISSPQTGLNFKGALVGL